MPQHGGRETRQLPVDLECLVLAAAGKAAGSGLRRLPERQRAYASGVGMTYYVQIHLDGVV